MKQLTIAAVFGATLLGAANPAAAQNITVADAFPSGHYLAEEAMKYWMDLVTEKTDGAVGFTYFPSGQMGALSDMLDMAASQVAQVTYVPMSSFSDRLPLTGVAELPGFFATAAEGTAAFNTLLDEYLTEKEFVPEGVLPLFGATLPPYQLASTVGPITNSEQMEGLRLRTPGGILEIAADAVGATPVPMGGPDMYAALQRGTVDATVNAFASLSSYKLNELLNAVSDNASFGTFAFTVVINQDTFEGFSEEVRAAMLEAGDETAKHVAQWMDENESTIAESFASEGVEIYSVPEDVVEEWQQKLSAVADQWASRLDSQGMAGSEAVERWEATIGNAE
ncbi:TRAP transporter substrate-binding protein [Paracoccus jeotgali]|uniref:TRAP transporter substrate-binding protein n=1 Tax=Paracoccus jeotgali TaxID=2065379 RepID=UPI0028A798E8|nr:TRAP transporter substrate-binding protein DctP [Paracoccus jeotgali]